MGGKEEVVVGDGCDGWEGGGGCGRWVGRRRWLWEMGGRRRWLWEMGGRRRWLWEMGRKEEVVVGDGCDGWEGGGGCGRWV